MDPWTILGWGLVGVMGLVVLTCLAFVIMVMTGLFLFIRDKRRLSKASKAAVEKGIVSFDAFEVGDDLKIGGRKWRVKEIETGFDIDYNQDKVLLNLRADRTDLLYGP